MTLTASRTDIIARLNDRCRMGLDRTARIVITRNCLGTFADLNHPAEVIVAQARLMRAFRACKFSQDSPEHDMAWITLGDVRLMMKIDYYDETMEWGSPDPADAAVTRRVMTIMLTEDY
jgi:hypothetical protein